MAIAIANGFSHRHNCVHYIKDRAYEEKDKAIALTEEVQKNHDELIEKNGLFSELVARQRLDVPTGDAGKTEEIPEQAEVPADDGGQAPAAEN